MIKFSAPKDQAVRLNQHFTDKLSDNLSDNFTDNLSDNLPDKELKILEFLLKDSLYATSQFAEKMHVSRVTVTKYLKAISSNASAQTAESTGK